jgi:hypothetical protein
MRPSSWSSYGPKLKPYEVARRQILYAVVEQTDADSQNSVTARDGVMSTKKA